MKGTPLEYFGKSALEQSDFTEIAGRYHFQRQEEQYLLQYLLEKLALAPQDDILEIGCGAGNLLIPLSFFVHSATGIDHPDLLSHIPKRLPKDSSTITLLPGDFRTIQVSGTFSRILIYSVIHYLRSEEEVLSFISKAASLLRPEGKMIIGDIPNKDIKARFLASERGKTFAAQWKKRVEDGRRDDHRENKPLAEDTPLVTIGNAFVEKILETLRGLHMRALRVVQPETLSFCFTREDIIAEKE